MLFFLLFLVNSFYRINGINITSIRYQGAYLIQIECKWNDNKKTLNPIDLHNEDNYINMFYTKEEIVEY